MVANNEIIPDEILELYKEEISTQILIDMDELDAMGVQVIEDNFLNITNKQARHNPIKTALAIFTYLTNDNDGGVE